MDIFLRSCSVADTEAGATERAEPGKVSVSPEEIEVVGWTFSGLEPGERIPAALRWAMSMLEDALAIHINEGLRP